MTKFTWTWDNSNNYYRLKADGVFVAGVDRNDEVKYYVLPDEEFRKRINSVVAQKVAKSNAARDDLIRTSEAESKVRVAMYLSEAERVILHEWDQPPITDEIATINEGLTSGTTRAAELKSELDRLDAEEYARSDLPTKIEITIVNWCFKWLVPLKPHYYIALGIIFLYMLVYM